MSNGNESHICSSADLSAIDGKRDLYVSKAIHKAVIEVNEEGTEASAATDSIVAQSRAKPKDFNANHPFLFFIIDKRDAMILFAGIVNKLHGYSRATTSSPPNLSRNYGDQFSRIGSSLSPPRDGHHCCNSSYFLSILLISLSIIILRSL